MVVATSFFILLDGTDWQSKMEVWFFFGLGYSRKKKQIAILVVGIIYIFHKDIYLGA